MKNEIKTAEHALALANVINPGGQRMQPDGEITPGIDEYHERNCVLVALSTAAFLSDGTEAAAFAVPSPLSTSLYSPLIGEIVGSEIYAQLVINQGPDTRIRSDDIVIEQDEILSTVKELCAKTPNKAWIVQGRYSGGNHWFNISSEGEVIDSQTGLIGENFLLGQLTGEGLQEFHELRLYQVDPNVPGKQIIIETQAAHQFLSMRDLAWHITSKLGLDQEINVRDLTDKHIKPHIEKNRSTGKKTNEELYLEKTPDWFNDFTDQTIMLLDSKGKDGKQLFKDILEDALTPTENKLTSDGKFQQSWLSEATYRDPGSTKKTQSVAQTMSSRCPAIKDALRTIALKQPDFGR